MCCCCWLGGGRQGRHIKPPPPVQCELFFLLIFLRHNISTDYHNCGYFSWLLFCLLTLCYSFLDFDLGTYFVLIPLLLSIAAQRPSYPPLHKKPAYYPPGLSSYSPYYSPPSFTKNLLITSPPIFSFFTFFRFRHYQDVRISHWSVGPWSRSPLLIALHRTHIRSCRTRS